MNPTLIVFPNVKSIFNNIGSASNSKGHLMLTSRFFTFLFIFLFFSLRSFSAVVTATWDGSSSTDWGDLTNWDINVVPNNGTDTYFIVIPSGLSNYPTIGAVSYTISGITSMANGASLSGSTGVLTLLSINTTTITGTATISCLLTSTVITTFSPTSASDQLTISNVFSGTGGGITKAGSGKLVLTGANTFTGAVIINTGILSANTVANASSASSLGTGAVTPAITIAGAGTFQYTGAVGSSSRAIVLSGGGATIDASGSGALTLSGGVTGATFGLILTGTGTATQSGIIGTTSGTVTKNGTGTWVLSSAANSFTGAVTINAGILSGNTVANASTVSSFGTGGTTPAITIGGSGTLQYTGAAGSSSRAITLSGSGATIDASGSGLLTLSGAVTGATFGLVLTGSGSCTMSGVIGTTTGSVTKTGTNTIILSGSNTYTGATIINNGTLKAGRAAVSFGVGSAVTMANVATAIMDITGFATTIGSLTGGGTTGGNITLGAAILTVGSDNTSPAAYQGIISGSGGITKSGSGVLTLTGASTFTGAVTISAGVLSVDAVADASSTSPLGTGAVTPAITILAGATLRYVGSANSSTARVITLSTSGVIIDASGSGLITFTSAFSTNNRSVTLTGTGFGAISATAATGSGVLTKNGTGTWTILGACSHSGGTIINDGTVIVSNASAFGTAARLLTMNGGTLDIALNSTINAHPTTINGNATIISNRSSAGVGVAHTLGTLSIGADDELNLTSGSNVTSDTARLIFGATTLSAATPILDVASGALLTLGALTGNFAFTKQGVGTMVLNSTSTRTGLFTISAGTVRIGTPGGIGAAAATITMTGGTLDLSANLSVNAHPTTIDGNATIISNRASAGIGVAHTLGTLSIGTSDQLNLATGANVTSDTARLTFGATTLSGATPILDIASGAILTLGALTGDVAFTKQGSGTMVLNTASSRTGLFTITAGAVRLGTASGIGLATATVTMSGGTLNLTGNSSVNAHPITINGNATIISNRPATGAGITHTLGTLSMGSHTLVIEGGLAVNNGTASIVFGTVTLSGNPIYNVTNPAGGGATALSLPQALSASTRSITKQGNGALNFGSTAVSLNSLTISTGTLLSTSNTLTLAGSFTNDGTFTHNSGTVVMAGTTQSIGGANAITFNTLTVNSGSTTTLTKDIQCVTDLNVNSGGIFDLVAQTANRSASGGTLTVAGELRLGHNTGGKTGSNFPENYTILTLTGSTIAYTRLTGGQTVFVTPYNNLTIGNTSNTNTAGGDLTVDGVLTTALGGTFDMSTHQLSGTLTSVSNGGIIQTSATDNPPIPTGKNWGSGTVIYALNAGGQTIAAGTYGTLKQQNTSGTNTLSGNCMVDTALNFGTTGTGKLTLGSNTLTLNGSITNMDVNRSLTANGSSNITIGGSGALGSSLFLDTSSRGTSNRLNNLTYNRSSETITLGDTLEITGTITPTAGTLATNDKLKLISNASGTARVAQGTGTYITGNVTAERFVPALSFRRWRFLGSAISNGTLAGLQDDIFITGAGTGFDATASNKPSVFSYTESAAGSIDAGWVAPTNTGDAITVGKGYRIFIRGDRAPGRLDGSITDQNAVTLDLVGTLNQGDISLPVTYTVSGGAASDGWNLVANPYASPISWNSIHDAGRNLPDTFNGTSFANIRQTIYIFNGATNSYTSYNAVSDIGVGNLGLVASKGIIPAGAAFWVQAVAASPSLMIKEIHKTDSIPASVFKTGPSQFTIKLIMDSSTSDEAAFKYIPGTSGGLDGYDIAKMYGADVNIASIGTDGSFLSANCKPFNGHSDTIPLSLGFANSGEYKMEFINPSGLGLDADKSVYLVDQLKQQLIDVSATNAYNFTVDKNDTATFGNSRFMLVVGEVTTAIPEFKAEVQETKLYLYPTITTGTTTVYNRGNIKGDVEVTVTDVSGKIIAGISGSKWENNQLTVDLKSCQTGLYFINILNHNQIVQTLRCIRE